MNHSLDHLFKRWDDELYEEVQEILQEKGYSQNEFSYTTEKVQNGYKIIIKRNNREIQYFEPEINLEAIPQSLRQVVKWTTQFILDLESGSFD
jgi:hypothetical protein